MLTHEIERELRWGANRELVEAQVRQRRIAQAQEERRFIDGIGQVVASIDPVIRAYWERRRPGCWRDKSFLRAFLRDNPECRVKSKGKVLIRKS